MPLCALATLLECLVPLCEHQFSPWPLIPYSSVLEVRLILELLKRFLRPKVVTILAFVVLHISQRTGHLFKGRILAKI